MIAGPAAPLIAAGLVCLVLAATAYAVEQALEDGRDESADWLGIGSDSDAGILPHDEGDIHVSG